MMKGTSNSTNLDRRRLILIENLILLRRIVANIYLLRFCDGRRQSSATVLKALSGCAIACEPLWGSGLVSRACWGGRRKAGGSGSY